MKMTVSIALILLSLWGGSWLIDTVSDTYIFAARMTALLIGTIGIVLLVDVVLPEDF